MALYFFILLHPRLVDYLNWKRLGNVAKNLGDVNRKATVPNKDNARSKATEECEMLQLFF